MQNWNSLADFFGALHKNNVNYLVLRNYEDFNDDDFLMQGHADIDLLCDDRNYLLKIAGVDYNPSSAPEFAAHCRTNIAGKFIPLDIREAGDGYYCDKWENDMLANRKLYNNFCYVMDDVNYFYSLIYHATLQKHSLSTEYSQRLRSMGENLGLDVNDDNLIEILESYMNAHDYIYVYPQDYGVIDNFRNAGVNRKMLRKNYYYYRARAIKTKNFVRRVLRAVISPFRYVRNTNGGGV